MDTPRAHHGESDEDLIFDRDAFRKARRRAGVTLAELAQATGTSESGMKKLQAGYRLRPRQSTYRSIIARLGLSYGDLWVETTPRDTHGDTTGGA
ncbi:hypothetical protein BJF83_17510 [Nocardiopsis sp. CNR-923]|nr:hypothetical protein BJF83_17510 [Nocardiopsis sp. CNR-923]